MLSQCRAIQGYYLELSANGVPRGGLTFRLEFW